MPPAEVDAMCYGGKGGFRTHWQTREQDAKTLEGAWKRRGGSDAARGTRVSGSARQSAAESALLSFVPSSERGIAVTPHVHS